MKNELIYKKRQVLWKFKFLQRTCTYSPYEKFQATRAKVVPVIFLYGHHFSVSEATYEVSQNTKKNCRITVFTRGRRKSVSCDVEFKIM